MLNVVQFREAVEYFKTFPYTLLFKSLSAWGGAMQNPRDFI